MVQEWWDEEGYCRGCGGSGYVQVNNSARACNVCKGQKYVNNSKAAKEKGIKRSTQVCPVCGGRRTIAACCGQPEHDCPACT